MLALLETHPSYCYHDCYRAYICWKGGKGGRRRPRWEFPKLTFTAMKVFFHHCPATICCETHTLTYEEPIELHLYIINYSLCLINAICRYGFIALHNKRDTLKYVIKYINDVLCVHGYACMQIVNKALFLKLQRGYMMALTPIPPFLHTLLWQRIANQLWQVGFRGRNHSASSLQYEVLFVVPIFTMLWTFQDDLSYE